VEPRNPAGGIVWARRSDNVTLRFQSRGGSAATSMRRFEHDGSGRVVLQATCNYLIPLAANVYSFAAKPWKCLKNIQPSKLMTRVRFPSPAPIFSSTCAMVTTSFCAKRQTMTARILAQRGGGAL
jgi:hypothetical protein